MPYIRYMYIFNKATHSYPLYFCLCISKSHFALFETSVSTLAYLGLIIAVSAFDFTRLSPKSERFEISEKGTPIKSKYFICTYFSSSRCNLLSSKMAFCTRVATWTVKANYSYRCFVFIHHVYDAWCYGQSMWLMNDHESHLWHIVNTRWHIHVTCDKF